MREQRVIAIERLASIEQIPAAEWDACTGGQEPFTSHGYLTALERSGSATTATGWQPCHLVARGPGGIAQGVCPAYIKDHSFGEFIFDWGWADAFERAGGRYYPKLQVAVPFTPVTGPRLAVHPDVAEPEAIRRALAGELTQICAELGLSSVHITFPRREEWEVLGELGWLQRTAHQYHWHNAGYRDFEDFLAHLSQRRRKEIRRERRALAGSGVEIHALSGDEVGAEHLDAFDRLYQQTCWQKLGPGYLTRRFFDELAARLGDRTLWVMARLDGAWIAGALHLFGTEALYGRNWGCRLDVRERVPYLHFELCYYQAIERAIAAGLPRVEAGVQGEHKLQRGYAPVPTYAAHWIAHPGLRDAVADFLTREREQVAEAIEILDGHTPYRER
ncbi:MAG: GNAT family N-acetyltransferase [Halorhodospira halophila]|uniref:GNAT family N-acetyltransferase n=1 Tax=Halorhodospira halophila TaxID=1053 RepID=UPI0026ECD6EB|nr:GNAT family N-acetyltransferase [Halorhodospira halophila]MCC3751161.1 GNAT family N-acetyltransferase [Halorhodospira halophila]